jgi:DNA-binding MarR family transcriptional regulator
MKGNPLRRLPPLNALKALEAAARHESFTRAAEELFVTQGAVRHQVKALEEELGVKLFNRERQRLVITEAGRQYLTTLRDAFDRIAPGDPAAAAAPDLRRTHGQHVTDFAAKWLVNRLGRFAEEHPSIDLRLLATLHHVDFAGENVDLAVRHRLRGPRWQQSDLISGRLLRPFGEELRLSRTYWIICPKATASLPKIVTFVIGCWARLLRISGTSRSYGIQRHRNVGDVLSLCR